jgi:transposase
MQNDASDVVDDTRSQQRIAGKVIVARNTLGAVHMQITTIGLDIAKNVFQVHGIDTQEKVVVRKQLRRGQVIQFFEGLSPCLVGLEACATSHYWARELARLGHDVRLMPAKDVKAYIKRNKNDAADAEAICEAVRRPTMRFVQVKSAAQQAQLMQHRACDLLMHQRTQLIKFGLPNDARASLIVLAAQLQALQTTIGRSRSGSWCSTGPQAGQATTIPGIGPIGASAIAATVTNPKIF